MIYCLMVSGPFRPTEKVRTKLLDIARLMVREGEREARIDLPECSGTIATEFDSISVGCLSGTRFEASVETPEGSVIVSFFVRTNDLEWLSAPDMRGEWGDAETIPRGRYH